MEFRFSTGFFFGLGVLAAVAVSQLATIAVTYGVTYILTR